MWIALITPLLISLGGLALVLAALIVFAETGLLAGFFLPGDSLLFTMGVLVASGTLSLPLAVVLLALAAAAVGGDLLGYTIGRRVGARLFSRPKSRIFDPAHLAKAERFVEKHGASAVIMARFIPWARTFVPVVVGVGAMPLRTFWRVNAVGAVVWVVGVTVAGYSLGQNDWVAQNVRLATFLLGIGTLLPVLAVRMVRRQRRDADNFVVGSAVSAT